MLLWPKETAHPAGTQMYDFVHLPPQASYPMGTDHAARDVLSRIIHGARISLLVGFGSVLIGVSAAFALAVVTSYAEDGLTSPSSAWWMP